MHRCHLNGVESCHLLINGHQILLLVTSISCPKSRTCLGLKIWHLIRKTMGEERFSSYQMNLHVVAGIKFNNILGHLELLGISTWHCWTPGTNWNWLSLDTKRTRHWWAPAGTSVHHQAQGTPAGQQISADSGHHLAPGTAWHHYHPWGTRHHMALGIPAWHQAPLGTPHPSQAPNSRYH